MAPRATSKFDATPLVDIEFQDLSYYVRAGRTKLDQKQILKDLSGVFLSGELTGILGGSGSGKTTLLNVLAGYVHKGYHGAIKINGKPREVDKFRKLSAYIMQEDLVQPYLTVREEIMTAAHLKLGSNFREDEKLIIVDEILNKLGLWKTVDTMVENLSGGEKKRLSIALELVSNPPVIFLDEPTSGLDTVAIKQCVQVLRTLTEEGRTVVCTIHQPSVTIMQQFHQLYFISNGKCVFNGSPPNMQDFLHNLHLECPITYNQAEFIIETVENKPDMTSLLSNSINNGKFNIRETAPVRKYELLENRSRPDIRSGVWIQFRVLLYRMMLQQKRNSTALWIQLFHHTVCGLLLGTLFFGLGNDANMAWTNCKMCLCIIVFFIYTHMMTPVLLFPFEFKILKREYFNRWYGLKPYYMALSIRRIPIISILGIELFMLIYWMSSQPNDWIRCLSCLMPSLITAVTSEGVGLAIGSVFNCRDGSIFGPTMVAPLVVFAIYGIDYSDQISKAMKVVLHTSYVRFAFVAMTLGLFKDRPPFDCYDEIYCHYKDYRRLLKDLGMHHDSYAFQMIGLVFHFFVFRIILYINLKIRLNPDFSQNVLNYVSKFLRR